LGVVDEKRMAKDTKGEIDSLSIKTPSQAIKVGNLSGGTQQKVILARWLLTAPDVLMLDEPTKGIDVAAKYHIYELMIELAKQGKAIIFVSSEMRELLGIADRILVMSNGRVAGIVDTSTTSQEEILKLATRYL
jgi:methyl-galactoside transport system ATP-binding protein